MLELKKFEDFELDVWAGEVWKRTDNAGQPNEFGTPVFSYLDQAAEIILNRLFPFGSKKIEALCTSQNSNDTYTLGNLAEMVPPCYRLKMVEIAVYLINKIGAEGQTAHSENGISRSYESASVPESMLKDIVPYASVFGC